MNNRQILAIFGGILSLAAGIFAVKLLFPGSEPVLKVIPEPQMREMQEGNSKLSGPYSYKNLTVYLIHGADALKRRTPLTLEEALARKLVVVHETEDVNELAVENLSKNEEVYIQAGDIVKGGKQDRVLAVDLIVPSRSGRLPIDSFCVEQGRWSARGNESDLAFDSSAEYAASKDLKMAARRSRSQSEVWNEVARSQEKLSAATNANTASEISRSSLPLTLEHPEVLADSLEYVNALSDVIKGKSEVTGFLFAINGEINSADNYGSGALFVKLWPKLLKAAAIEAVAESGMDEAEKRPSPDEVELFLVNSSRAPVVDERRVTDRVKLTTRETIDLVLLESFDRGIFLHASYLKK